MRLVDRLAGGAVGALFAALRRVDPDRASDLSGALARRLEPYELGRVVFHLNQRRGFRSNRCGRRRRSTETQKN